MKTPTLKMPKVVIISDFLVAPSVSDNNKLFSGLDKAKKSDRRVSRASADAGPELAGREAIAAMESPQADRKSVGRERVF